MTVTILGAITIDDVRTALGDTDPSNTNAGALRKLIGRGSLSTIQRHLDALRAEGVAHAFEVGGAAPDVPKDLISALWTHAWSAAQARTAGALAAAQQQVQVLTQQLAVAHEDAGAAQAEADEAEQTLAAVQEQLKTSEEAHALELAAAHAHAAAQAVRQEQELEALRHQVQQHSAALALSDAQYKAAEAALRGEVDRLVSQLADLRVALGRNQGA